MSVLGNSDRWSDLFPNDLISDILDLIISSWKDFSKPAINEIETRITRKFYFRLKSNKDLRKLPFIILREKPEDDLQTGEEIGRIDLQFIAGDREEVYFAFECKRLNVDFPSGKKSLAAEYVEEGMMRFIISKYSSSLSHGGMLGYIMDGDFLTATNAVEKKINDNVERLCMEARTGLLKSSIKASIEEIKETSHKLEKRTFTIHHIFLCF